jgi:hypothetical protein
MHGQQNIKLVVFLAAVRSRRRNIEVLGRNTSDHWLYRRNLDRGHPLVFKVHYRGADKSLDRPGRKKANVSRRKL